MILRLVSQLEPGMCVLLRFPGEDYETDWRVQSIIPDDGPFGRSTCKFNRDDSSVLTCNLFPDDMIQILIL